MISSLLVRLYSPAGDLRTGAERATAAGLGALFLDGIPTGALSGSERQALLRAAARTASDHALQVRELATVLDVLAAAGVRPALLKGLHLAQAWPRPELRPIGDLDLLIDAARLERAAGALERVGYRRGPDDPGGRWRPEPTGVELIAPPGRAFGVDLHARLFRSVGHGVDAGAVLARARPIRIGSAEVLALEPADELLFVYVHAAKHGVRQPKWLLDLHALAKRADRATWNEAMRHAVETGTARAFGAAARLVARLPGAAVPAGASPPALLAPIFDRLFTVDKALQRTPLGTAERYALELLLEPSVYGRARMAAGVVERLVTAAAGRR